MNTLFLMSSHSFKPSTLTLKNHKFTPLHIKPQTLKMNNAHLHHCLLRSQNFRPPFPISASSSSTNSPPHNNNDDKKIAMEVLADGVLKAAYFLYVKSCLIVFTRLIPGAILTRQQENLKAVYKPPSSRIRRIRIWRWYCQVKKLIRVVQDVIRVIRSLIGFYRSAMRIVRTIIKLGAIIILIYALGTVGKSLNSLEIFLNKKKNK